jgi:hypothetical protein
MFRGGGGFNPASVAITGGTISGISTIALASGSVGAPSYTFTGALTSGLFQIGGTEIFVTLGGTGGAGFTSTGLRLPSAGTVAWRDGAVQTGTADLVLARDAPETLAQKRSTNAQTFNHYGSEITAGTRYSRLAIKHATVTLSAVSGASVTATNLIPAKANVMGVNTVVTTGLGTGSGTTGYTVGDGADADRWGSVTGTVAGTDTDGNDATADPRGWFTAANNVVITAAGGNFNGTGAIFVDVAYWITEAD